jgi:hypothetical protein
MNNGDNDPFSTLRLGRSKLSVECPLSTESGHSAMSLARIGPFISLRLKRAQMPSNYGLVRLALNFLCPHLKCKAQDLGLNGI